jgi:hypothetical protein
MKGDAFVDDAGLGSTVALPQNADPAMVQRSAICTVENLQTIAQQWEKLLFSTGGELNLQKCFWFLLSWQWTGRRWKLNNTAKAPATLRLTSGNSFQPIDIKRIEPTASYRTLGVHISPSGCNKGAISVLQEIALDYAQAIAGSHLSRQDVLVSYVQHLVPRLRFQLPALTLSKAECNQLQSPAL